MYKMLLIIIILCSSNIVIAQPTVLYFGASWCGPCQEFKKTLHSPDVAKLLVQYNNFYVDIDEHPDLRTEYGVKKIPTVVIIDEKIVNGKEVETILFKEIYPSKQALKSALIKNLDKQAVTRPLLKIFEKPVNFFKKALDN
jgi:thioredoxin-like negative regulator of GroEL